MFCSLEWASCKDAECTAHFGMLILTYIFVFSQWSVVNVLTASQVHTPREKAHTAAIRYMSLISFTGFSFRSSQDCVCVGLGECLCLADMKS